MDPAVTTIVTGCIILLICVELNVVEIYYDNYMPYVIQYGGFFDNIHEMIDSFIVDSHIKGKGQPTVSPKIE